MFYKKKPHEIEDNLVRWGMLPGVAPLEFFRNCTKLAMLAIKACIGKKNNFS